jgi:hypothetical protein
MPRYANSARRACSADRPQFMRVRLTNNKLPESLRVTETSSIAICCRERVQKSARRQAELVSVTPESACCAATYLATMSTLQIPASRVAERVTAPSTPVPLGAAAVAPPIMGLFGDRFVGTHHDTGIAIGVLATIPLAVILNPLLARTRAQ